MRLKITPGDWEVVSGMRNALAVYNDITVIDSLGRALGDFKNNELPREQQHANACAFSAIPTVVRALNDLETVIGDMPRSPEADAAYQIVCKALDRVGKGRSDPQVTKG